jgi:hypothetical protein
MSGSFTVPPVPLMSAERAQQIARGYQAMAEQLEDFEDLSFQAESMSRRAQWWIAYAQSLAKTPPTD